MSNKAYLGDGVYAEFDGRLILTTEDGIGATDRIVLEPEVYLMLTTYVRSVRVERLIAGELTDKEPDA